MTGPATGSGQGWLPIFGEELAGKTIGLVGYGPINEAVALRARAFEMEVLVTRRSAAPSDLAQETFGPDGLQAMLGRCDIVAAAVPESPETHRLFDAGAFAAMRDGSLAFTRTRISSRVLAHTPGRGTGPTAKEDPQSCRHWPATW